MQEHPDAVDMWIGIKMIDTRGVECARATNDPMDFVAFLEQQIGEITAILSGNAGNERLLHFDLALLAYCYRGSK